MLSSISKAFNHFTKKNTICSDFSTIKDTAISIDMVQRLYNSYVNPNSLHFFACPCCGNHSFVAHAHYKRFILLPNGSFEKLSVLRVICSHCKKQKQNADDSKYDSIQLTHVVLPWWIPPYSSILTPVLLTMITQEEDDLEHIYYQLNVEYDTILRYRCKYKDVPPSIKTKPIATVLAYFYSFLDTKMPKYRQFMLAIESSTDLL